MLNSGNIYWTALTGILQYEALLKEKDEKIAKLSFGEIFNTKSSHYEAGILFCCFAEFLASAFNADLIKVDGRDWKISTSFSKNDNHGHITSAKPTIKITQKHIIIRHRIEGGGIIQNTT